MKIIGVIFALLTAGNAVAFGAVASSEHESGVAIGLSANQDSVHSARKAAIEQCKAAEGTNCIIAAEFTDTCAAIAVGNDKNGEPVGSFATNEDEADAIKDAIATCQEDGGKCEEHSSGCDGDPFVVHEEFADLTIPQICSQLCGDITEQRDITGELTLAAAGPSIPESADECITTTEKSFSYTLSGSSHGIKIKIHNNCSVFVTVLYNYISSSNFPDDIERGWENVNRDGRQHIEPDKFRTFETESTGEQDGFYKTWSTTVKEYCYDDVHLEAAGISHNPDPCPKEDE